MATGDLEEIYGDYWYLTQMAQNAPKGPPKQVFWEMEAAQSGNFDEALDEYIEMSEPTGGDALTAYEEDWDDVEDDGGAENDLIDDMFLNDPVITEVWDSFDIMEDGDLGAGLDVLDAIMEPNIPVTTIEQQPPPIQMGSFPSKGVYTGPTDDAPWDPTLDPLWDPPWDEDVASTPPGPGLWDRFVANIPFVPQIAAAAEDGDDVSSEFHNDVAVELNELGFGPDAVDKILGLLDQTNLTAADILGGMDDPGWKGTPEFRAQLELALEQRLGEKEEGVGQPSASVKEPPDLDAMQKEFEGELPAGATAYDDATENLTARFFTTIYKQSGVGYASQAELDSLNLQTQLLFFLEKGETAWENVLQEDASAMEGNYATYLDEYLARPFAQRLNPAAGPDFYSLVKDVSRIFTKSRETPDTEGVHAADWAQTDDYGVADRDKKIWVEGLFGEGQQDFRDELVKMGLTRGGMGYYSKRIHAAAQTQMDYYRDIGWSEEEVFDEMTKRMKKPPRDKYEPPPPIQAGWDPLDAVELGI
jgi:hypothetical protein